MNFSTMKPDVFMLPGNAERFDDRPWFYADQTAKDFHQAVLSSVPPLSPMNSEEISFEHFIPPTDQMESPSSQADIPDLSLSQQNGTSGKGFSKKEKSRKARISKQSPASEEDTPENKSMRRREQNRIAQRTFRERKDRYIQNLESHIKMLDASHKNLQASYRESTDQLNALYSQLVETQGELDYWRYLAQPPTTTTSAAAVAAVGATSSTPSSMTMHPHSHAHLSASRITPTMSPPKPPDMPISVTPRHHHVSMVQGMHIQHGQYS